MKIKFTHGRPTLLPPKTGEAPWTLVSDWGVEADGIPYAVPQGFETDGASIPRALWRVCGTPLSAPRLYAAIVHDAAYAGLYTITRKEADGLYRDIQIYLGVPKWKARLEYYALRVFGANHWLGETNK